MFYGSKTFKKDPDLVSKLNFKSDVSLPYPSLDPTPGEPVIEKTTGTGGTACFFKC
jgi:hypothetical protein